MKRIALLLGLLFAATLAHAANPSVHAATGKQGTTGTTTTNSITVAGNYQLVISFQATSSSLFPTSVTDTLGDTYTSVFGTINNVNSIRTVDGYKISAFYSYNGGSGSNAATVVYSGTSSSNFVFYADCANIAAVGAILSNIYNLQSALAAGTNAVTVAGGTGTDNIPSQPALVLVPVILTAGTLTVGTSPVAFSTAATVNAAVKMQDALVTSTFPSFDSAATNSATTTAITWQLVLAGDTAPPTTNGQQFFLQ